MSNNKRYYWLKLMDDFFSQPKIKKLRKIAGGDTYTIIYLKLQLLSLKNGGKLFFEGIENNVIEELSLTIDEDVENVEITFQYLLSQGLIEEITDDEFVMTETSQLIGSETASTIRSRKSRNKKNVALQHYCNTIATKCNGDIDIDKDIDIYKKKENNKKKEKVSFDSILEELNDEDLKNSFLEFIKMRKLIKKPLTEHALKLSIKKLFSLSNDKQEMIDIVNQSIQNSWQSFYPLKEEKNDKKIFSDDFAF